MRLVDYARDVTMLYGIPMNVIHMARIVGVITNAVSPKPPLPDAALPTLEPYIYVALNCADNVPAITSSLPRSFVKGRLDQPR